jgi:hypothetical protein
MMILLEKMSDRVKLSERGKYIIFSTKRQATPCGRAPRRHFPLLYTRLTVKKGPLPRVEGLSFI